MPTPISDGTVPWPEEDAARYVAAGYWIGQPLGDLLHAAAERTPHAVALVDGAVRFGYAELLDRIDAAAGRLLDLGLAAGDRIVVQLANGWEFVVLTGACLRAGIVPVMALPGHRRTELAYLVRHSAAAAIAVPDRLRDFDHQRLAHELAGETTGPWHVLVAGAEIGPGSVDLRSLCAPAADPAVARARLESAPPGSRDVAVFLLSGGTTGLPKLIARTHDDYAYNARGSAEVCGVDSDTVYLVSLPAGHNFPLACPGIIGTLLAGGTVVMLPSPEPGRAFATIAAESVTHTAVVPAVAGRWLEHAEAHGAAELTTLRVLQVGGARSPTSWPAGCARCLARGCSRSSGWPRGCSTTPGWTIPRRSSAPPRGARCPRTTRFAWSTSPTGRCPTASPGRCSLAVRTRRGVTTGRRSTTPARSPPTAGIAAATSAGVRRMAILWSRAATKT